MSGVSPKVNIPANEEAFSILAGKRLLCSDLCFCNVNDSNHNKFHEKLGNFSKQFIDSQQDCNIDSGAILKCKLSSDGCFGDKISIAPDPKAVDTISTIKNIIDYCKGSLENLSVMVICSMTSGGIKLFKTTRRDPDSDYFPSDQTAPLEQKYLINICTLDGKINVICRLSDYWIDYRVNTREEQNIAADIFCHPSDSKKSCIVFKDDSINAQVQYVLKTSQGYTTKYMDVNYVECDVNTNYNDDLNIDRINSFLASDDPGIMIFHGDPGTGKTTFIRKLIWDNAETNSFIIMDKAIFHDLTDSTLMSFLLENTGAVIIFEDCEDLLRERSSGNSAIASLLNLSDGILGDMLHLKFICTFNEDLVQVDKALLRKGRLKYIYDFKPLKHDKAVALAEKLGKDPATLPDKDTPLCDIYNLSEDVGKQKKKTKPIGFGS